MASALCCSNPPNLSATSGEGTVVDDFGGIKAYIAGSADSKRAVILISDVYGFEAPNLRKIADKVAACGYFVVVPDFIHGDPFKLDDSTRPFPVWLQSHTTENGFEEAKPVVAALKAQGASSVGAAGYCWGAKVVTELAKAAEIQAAVLLHPSLVSVDDMNDISSCCGAMPADMYQCQVKTDVKLDRMRPLESYVNCTMQGCHRRLHQGLDVTVLSLCPKVHCIPQGSVCTKVEHFSPTEVKCPIAILGAETDHLSPPELVKQYEEALAKKSEVDYFVKIFPGVAHGWAVRYKADDATAVQKADEARTDMVEWFNKHLV